MLDLEELLAKIPQLIARLTRFSAFSVYLLDERRQDLRIAYAVGYPEEVWPTLRLPVGARRRRRRGAGRPPDSRQRHSPGAAIQGPAAQHAVAARRADAAQRQGHRRAESAERGRRRVHRRRTRRSCGSLPRTSPSRSKAALNSVRCQRPSRYSSQRSPISPGRRGPRLRRVARDRRHREAAQDRRDVLQARDGLGALLERRAHARQRAQRGALVAAAIIMNGIERDAGQHERRDQPPARRRRPPTDRARQVNVAERQLGIVDRLVHRDRNFWFSTLRGSASVGQSTMRIPGFGTAHRARRGAPRTARGNDDASLRSWSRC